MTICVTHSALRKLSQIPKEVCAHPVLQVVSVVVPFIFVHPAKLTTTSDLINCAMLLVVLGLMVILRQRDANYVPTIATHALKLVVACLATPPMTSGLWIT